MKSKKGFTVLEVVIALSIIILVSGSMLLAINFSIKSNNDLRVKSFFISESENYISAYYLGEEKYEDAMSLLTGGNYTYGDNATIYYDNNLEKTSDNSATYHIDIIFSIQSLVVRSYKNTTLIYECEA